MSECTLTISPPADGGDGGDDVVAGLGRNQLLLGGTGLALLVGGAVYAKDRRKKGTIGRGGY